MFKIGDKVAHPMHGAGIIDGIEERTINGCTRQYYVLKMPTSDMIVMVPVDTCEAIGVRPIIDPKAAQSLLDKMASIETDMTQNWNRRYRENMQRIKSGDLLEVAKVVKSLVKRDAEKGLSTGERKMLHSAKQILISELVLCQKKTYEEVETWLNAVLT